MTRSNPVPATLHVSIDGREYDLPSGGTVLDALRAVGLHVPTLCHDDRIAPSGACRSCLVQFANWPRPLPACSIPLLDGMEIESHTPQLEEFRRSLLQMLARRYPAEVVDAFPDLPFHRELRDRGVVPPEAAAPSGLDLRDQSHPYLAVDMARCIDCYRCVRICAEVQGQFVWHVRGRGFETKVRPDGPSLRDSSCVSCGACVDTCPTGALQDRSIAAHGVPSRWTRTTCPYCGVGCELNVGTADGRIVTVRPVLDAPVNKGHLCVKGRYAFDFVSAPDRVTEPMIRAGGDWRRVSWAEAYRFVADGLQQLIRRHGPDSVGVLGSARATNEENYLAQKFARTVIGTNNVDCCARVCHAPSAAALKRVLGAGLATNSFDDIERARTILVCGANACESHPIVGARIKQAVLRGARLVVVDPRSTELADYADCHLAVRPGTDIPLFHAMAHTIVAEHLQDRSFLGRRVSGLEEFSAFVHGWPPERAAEICGVAPDEIRRAARLYAGAAPALSVHGLGLTEHVQGTDTVVALINLALLTGNVGKPGAGINPLRGQNNVQGSAHMGCDPAMLTGAIPLEQGRGPFEHVWGAPLPVTRGLHLLEMMDAAIDGRLKGLWAIGYDVLLTNADASATRRALGNMDLVVVQDMFLTETAREFGSVLLPACSSFEKDGTFMNAERRIQRVRAALAPLGESRPDWRILCDVAREMGAAGFEFSGPEAVWDEVRSLCEGARGMTYARLDSAGLQWPCPALDHPGTSILHRRRFTIGERAALQAVEYRPTPEAITADYPFALITGRSLYQFNTATMTGRTRNSELRPSDVLDLSPEDAARLGIAEGELVRVVSRYGAARLPAHATTAVRPNQLFATFQQPEVFLNALTSPHRDACTGTPEYKMTAVRIERIDA